jgi:hypothetical protein
MVEIELLGFCSIALVAQATSGRGDQHDSPYDTNDQNAVFSAVVSGGLRDCAFLGKKMHVGW